MQVLVVDNGSRSVERAQVAFDSARPSILGQSRWPTRGRDPGALIGEFPLAGSEVDAAEPLAREAHFLMQRPQGPGDAR